MRRALDLEVKRVAVAAAGGLESQFMRGFVEAGAKVAIIDRDSSRRDGVEEEFALSRRR